MGPGDILLSVFNQLSIVLNQLYNSVVVPLADLLNTLPI